MDIITQSLAEAAKDEDRDFSIYKHLNNCITPIGKDEKEFVTISKNISHTPYPYKITLLNLFRLERTSSKPEAQNRRLLYLIANQVAPCFLKLIGKGPQLPAPGSGKKNFIPLKNSFPSQNNLSTNETEMPSLPYGNGIYFSDCINKSANNCSSNLTNSIVREINNQPKKPLRILLNSFYFILIAKGICYAL